jgi:hypothetical protein
VGRQANSRRRIEQRVADRLLDPVTRIGAESCAKARLKLLRRADQPKISLADQVLQTHATANVIPRNLDDQPQIGLDHPGLRMLVPAGDRVGEGTLIGGCQQGFVPDLAKVHLKRIGGTGFRRPSRIHSRTSFARPLKWR